MSDSLELPQVQNMTEQERVQAAHNVAMKSADHLVKWTEATGKQWLLFNTKETINALPWPDGHQFLQQIIMCIRDQRIGDGKTEELTMPELDRAIRFLIGKVTEIDPNWSLENPPA